jgi:hypothetical protein
MAVVVLTASSTAALPEDASFLVEWILPAGCLVSALLWRRDRGPASRVLRAASVLGALVYPAWLFALIVVFSLPGIVLGLHDAPLPGESARRALHAAVGPWLVNGFRLCVILTWATIFGLGARSVTLGLLTVAAGLIAAFIVQDEWLSRFIWLGGSCSMILTWAALGPPRAAASAPPKAGWRRYGKGRCPSCGYDRAGLAEGAACPECGGKA